MADWRANLKRNWLYMLTAALLSLFLWVAVSADRVDERTYSADLLIVNSDRRYVETRREPDTDEVTVDFTGRVGELARLAVARPQLVYPIDSVDSTILEVRLTPDRVTGRGGAPLEGVSAIRVQPDRFLLHFQLRGTQTVPVVPNLSRVSLEDGYVMSDLVRVEPDMVVLDGPEDIVRAIEAVQTAPVPGAGLRESTTVDVPLVSPGGLVGLSAASASVTISVEPLDERVFPGIPLVVSGADVEGLRVEPSLVDVRLSGPRSAVEAVRPEALSPQVELRGRADLGRLLPIVLPAPAPFVTVTVDPDSARVVESGG
ncbi:MAG: CdaR family protein [Gemmatimonadales bacterium]|jgi:YbbR domain-containing protein